MIGDHRLMPAGHRESQHDVDPASAGRLWRLEECASLGVKLTNDLLEAPHSCLDLEQNCVRRSLKAKVDRSSARPRYGGLDRGAPTWLADPQQLFDDPGLNRIPDQRT